MNTRNKNETLLTIIKYKTLCQPLKISDKQDLEHQRKEQKLREENYNLRLRKIYI